MLCVRLEVIFRCSGSRKKCAFSSKKKLLLYLILLDWSVPINHNDILVIFNNKKENFDTSFKSFDYFDLKLFTVSGILIKYIQDYVTIILQIKIIWIEVNLSFRCERQLICYKVYEYECVREYSIYEVD